MISMRTNRTAVYKIPADLAETTRGKNRTLLIEQAVSAVWSDASLLAGALGTRASNAKKVAESVQIGATISDECVAKLESLAERTGLSLNQLVALSLEARLAS